MSMDFNKKPASLIRRCRLYFFMMIALPSFLQILGNQPAFAQSPTYTYVDGSSLRVFGMAATVPE